MISRNTKKIILYLLKNFENNSINQISRKLNISVGSAFKILKNLEMKKFVLSENIGNVKKYWLNFEEDQTIKICEFLLIEERNNLKGFAKIYFEELKEFENANLIILFGSILDKKSFNDVDVLFMTNKIKQVNDFCLSISRSRSKPIVPLILKEQDLINKVKIKNEVILDIIRKGIVIKGESVFLEVIKNARY